jgi:ectoine hydroxylase-related dioxygenase (phytanoyl-CoA dioxygenase family)
MSQELLSNIDPAVIRREFEENGFYLAKGVFSKEELVELERDFDRIVHQITATDEETNARWAGPEMDRLNVSDTVVTHTHNVHKYSAVWTKALLQQRFLDITEAILGPDIVMHHTKLFQKPAENGAPFPMHQDWDYFPTVRDTMMAGIIHVSRATDEMGCLRVYPGSHKLGRLNQSNGHADGEILRKYPIEGATPVETEPGDVIFFHYFTIHGSMPNRSSEIRKTVLIEMHSGDDHVEDGIMHPNARLTLRGFNHHITRSIANED